MTNGVFQSDYTVRIKSWHVSGIFNNQLGQTRRGESLRPGAGLGLVPVVIKSATITWGTLYGKASRGQEENRRRDQR